MGTRTKIIKRAVQEIQNVMIVKVEKICNKRSFFAHIETKSLLFFSVLILNNF